jgi:TPP-dependent pyruvate/acetoin dehydrogenase alpha subunit
MDLVRVLEATAYEVGRCRGGDGPALIEFETYRFRGHYGGDPEHTYRTKDEVAEWRKRCPVAQQRRRLIEGGVPEADIAALEAQIDDGLAQDEAWALEQPFPTVEQATDHVWTPF